MADFVTTYLGDAQVAARHLGMPVSVILAQWINETGGGTSSAFRNQNNFAGVSLNGQIMSFPDKSAGLTAYIQRWGDPVYNPTRATIAAAGGIKANPYTAAQAVEQSPWAAGHYGGNGLEHLIADQNLSQYDVAGPVPAPDQFSPGSSSDGSSSSSSSSSGITETCILKLPSVDLKLFSLGGNCLLHSNQGRALLGAFCLVTGAGVMLIGLGFVAIGGNSPLAKVAPLLAAAA